jgi:hypothetical protein
MGLRLPSQLKDGSRTGPGWVQDGSRTGQRRGSGSGGTRLATKSILGAAECLAAAHLQSRSRWQPAAAAAHVQAVRTVSATERRLARVHVPVHVRGRGCAGSRQGPGPGNTTAASLSGVRFALKPVTRASGARRPDSLTHSETWGWRSCRNLARGVQTRADERREACGWRLSLGIGSNLDLPVRTSDSFRRC